MSVLKNIFEPKVRSYIYRICIAVMVLLGAIGILSDELFTPIIGLVMAILGLGMADANVPTRREQAVLEEVGNTPKG